ncbi:hypothetical protein DFR31_0533 [Alkalispirillum mobile]|uniref:Tail sheath protein C-terminal domain-containing protein n=1 Tax=Alkalispirillum mobile TaxID=85925 RepID=A0A498C6E1_9GAMM|nr:phage tail sheath C-terminal domain-containing protein [Alkalispirillum mobile]RLK50627.1 hypothetical protein DFR31_0533 [Alkalispirillum mobile]
MASYLHPGVYIEEIPSGSRPIDAAGTSTAAFIGYATRGPVDEPVFITSWEDYENTFGGIRDVEESVSGAQSVKGDTLGLSVFAYFQNGGGKAYVIRTASGEKTAKGALEDSGNDLVGFQVVNPGAWGNQLRLHVTAKEAPPDTSDPRFTVEIGRGDGDDFVADETFTDVSLAKGDSAYLKTVLKEGSELLRVSDESGMADAVAVINSAGTDGVTVEMSDGDDGSHGGSDEYNGIFSKLLKYRDINIILLPDQTWGDSGQGIIESAISHCETMKNRMVIFDLPPGEELNKEKDVTDLGLTTSTYAATYYPWALVSNPHYNPDTNPGAERLVLAPAGGFVAGQWARTDGRRGVWKAPAGVETNLLGISKLLYTVEDAEQQYLNPLGVNALRQLPNYGSVIWGSRTRATRANPEWRYIPVRRTAIFIEESIFHGIHWAVFEPNDHRLWSALRTNIESFLGGLHRSGAFQGEKASDAYFVRCGLGQTMRQGDIDRGQVIVEVGFAPLKPAEFVIVRIQQKVGQQ